MRAAGHGAQSVCWPVRDQPVKHGQAVYAWMSTSSQAAVGAAASVWRP